MRGRTPRLVRLLAVPIVAIVLGCSGLIGGSDAEYVASGHQLLDAGDLPGALAEFSRLYAEDPTSVGAASGYSYLQMLSGDLDGADQTLAAAEPTAGERLGEVRLRRALVALRRRDFDAVRTHGTASNLPEGLLLAAEVHLIDLRSAAATELLTQVASTGGVVGNTANMYLRMLDSGNPNLASLADTTALWALGDRQAACVAAEELVKELPQGEGRDVQLLLWAGRAATSELPKVARNLLEAISFPPEGQEWREQATHAMLDIAEGKVDQGMTKFRVLKDGVSSGVVPRDGLDDALTTACALARDPEIAARLVEGMESAAASRCLMQAGDGEAARDQAPAGPLRTFLEAP